MNNISMSQTTQYPESAAQSDDEAIIIKNGKEIVSRKICRMTTFKKVYPINNVAYVYF